MFELGKMVKQIGGTPSSSARADIAYCHYPTNIQDVFNFSNFNFTIVK